MVLGAVRIRRLCPRLLLTVEGSPIDWQSNYIFFSSSSLKCLDLMGKSMQAKPCIIGTSLGTYIYPSTCIWSDWATQLFFRIPLPLVIASILASSVRSFFFSLLFSICLPRSNIYRCNLSVVDYYFFSNQNSFTRVYTVYSRIVFSLTRV